MTKPNKALLLIAGNYPSDLQPQLTQLSSDTGLKLIPASIDGFASGERFCELYPAQADQFITNKQEITGAHVHVVMPMHNDSSTFFTDAIGTVDTLKRFGAASIHFIMPFAPFARQDRAFNQRFTSVMGETFPKHLKFAGVDQITTFDLHSKAAEQFYIDQFGAENVNIINANPLFNEALMDMDLPLDSFKFSAPDGADKPDDIAQRQVRDLEKNHYGVASNFEENGLGIIKTHISANETKAVKAFGTAKGFNVIERDDMIDTGGTITNGAQIYAEDGAGQVIVMATHPVLSGNSLDILTRAENNPITKLYLTDTITNVYDKVAALPKDQQARVEILSTLPLIKKALTHTFG